MEPHPVLAAHYAEKDAKQPFLRKVFDEAAPYYEGIAKWGWFGSGQWYRKEALKRAGLTPGMKVLDVASGTGPTARAIHDIVQDTSLITCLEPSAGMIAESEKLLKCKHIQATANDMPVESNAYDFLTMGFALRHVEDLEGAFREYHRALKSGGKVLILDVTTPKSKVGYIFMKLYFKHILPFFTKIFTGSEPARYLMAYYWETMDNMVPSETVTALLEKVGFTNVKLRVQLGIFSEYEGVR
ncbi:MAG: methyltransferase type 11 [Rickettsiales bacterium]|jgi:demethylmenaquinone methyltransferase/2-methoxy-6-polyprenyl-1,4-benzoquinol methylase|nr:methyltransferase type 11 [Rickettsiales bacterium]